MSVSRRVGQLLETDHATSGILAYQVLQFLRLPDVEPPAVFLDQVKGIKPQLYEPETFRDCILVMFDRLQVITL